jgi:hypothetical protein
VKRVIPNPIFCGAILLEFVFFVSARVIAPVVPVLAEFMFDGFDLGPVDEVVEEVLGRRRLGRAVDDGAAGFSFVRLVRNAPRTFSSSCWSGDWAKANTVSVNTNALERIFHFICGFLPKFDLLDPPATVVVKKKTSPQINADDADQKCK